MCTRAKMVIMSSIIFEPIYQTLREYSVSKLVSQQSELSKKITFVFISSGYIGGLGLFILGAAVKSNASLILPGALLFVSSMAIGYVIAQMEPFNPKEVSNEPFFS